MIVVDILYFIFCEIKVIFSTIQLKTLYSLICQLRIHDPNQFFCAWAKPGIEVGILV